MVDRFRLVECIVASSEFSMLSIFCIVTQRLFAIRCKDIVWTEIKGTQSIEGYFAIKTKAIETDGIDFLTMFVQGFDLQGLRKILQSKKM